MLPRVGNGTDNIVLLWDTVSSTGEQKQVSTGQGQDLVSSVWRSARMEKRLPAGRCGRDRVLSVGCRETGELRTVC